jgi:hypothetical protein
MKLAIFTLFVFYLIACTDRSGTKNFPAKKVSGDTIIKHDTVYINNDNNWQQGFGLTHEPEIDSVWGKPVKFYIDNPNCSPIAIDFYLGEFRPTDNNTTAALLSLVTTNDNSLRPFYRWCLNKTIQIEDGALAEYTGIPARQYAEKFPKEFFEYMEYDTTKEKYRDWVGSISYSGYYDTDDSKKSNDIRDRMTKKMKQNCTNCVQQMIKRIDTLAMDCFP